MTGSTSQPQAVSVSLPGHRAPAAGYEAPFDMLHACHERVQRMLSLLRRLHQHVQKQGADEQSQQAARDIMRYFDQSAPQHHLDEERHVFPSVLALQQEALTQVVERLQADHHEMETAWARTREYLLQLLSLGADSVPSWCQQAQPVFAAFALIYDRHIADEEQLVFPASRHILGPQALQAMSQDMMRRRGVKI
jgi:hemerythrin-like domain-containing protein